MTLGSFSRPAISSVPSAFLLEHTPNSIPPKALPKKPHETLQHLLGRAEQTHGSVLAPLLLGSTAGTALPAPTPLTAAFALKQN